MKWDAPRATHRDVVSKRPSWMTDRTPPLGTNDSPPGPGPALSDR